MVVSTANSFLALLWSQIERELLGHGVLPFPSDALFFPHYNTEIIFQCCYISRRKAGQNRAFPSAKVPQNSPEILLLTFLRLTR